LLSPILKHNRYSSMQVSRKNSDPAASENGSTNFSEMKKGILRIITHNGELVPGVGTPILYWKKYPLEKFSEKRKCIHVSSRGTPN